MTALVFGEEKRANPNPKRTRLAMIWGIGVSGARNVRRARPRVVSAMPADATYCGSTRSESLPAGVAKSAWTTGCVIRMSPAVPGSSPLTTWR